MKMFIMNHWLGIVVMREDAKIVGIKNLQKDVFLENEGET